MKSLFCLQLCKSKRVSNHFVALAMALALLWPALAAADNGPSFKTTIVRHQLPRKGLEPSSAPDLTNSGVAPSGVCPFGGPGKYYLGSECLDLTAPATTQYPVDMSRRWKIDIASPLRAYTVVSMKLIINGRPYCPI